MYEDCKMLCWSMEEADGAFFFNISVYCTCKQSGVCMCMVEGGMLPWKEVS